MLEDHLSRRSIRNRTFEKLNPSIYKISSTRKEFVQLPEKSSHGFFSFQQIKDQNTREKKVSALADTIKSFE